MTDDIVVAIARTARMDPAMQAMPFAVRRSIRRYLKIGITQATVEDLIAAAITAPSAHNRQPWRFVVVRSAAAKNRLAHAMGDKLRADRRGDGDPDEIVEADVARSFARMTGAAALVLVCLTMADMDEYRDQQRNHAEYLMTVQSTAMAGQNLLLAASAAGLGACWLCAPIFCSDVVSETLELPADWQPQGMITLGYPADAGKPYTRRPLLDVTRFL
jgi:coenzyme F420-0:L-glutamate ligase/coenzyme F420-1:gamma-L-glutamate ligase